MRRTMLILFSTLAIISCKSKTANEGNSETDSIASQTIPESSSKDNATPVVLNTIEDTIRYHFGIPDSLNVISTKYYGTTYEDEHVRVFVDNNTNSIFHDEILSDYGCECKDEELYNSIYKESFQKYNDSINVDYKKYKDFFGHWIPIQKHENKFYLERIVCEFNRHGFTLSDSALVKYYMDGLSPSLLLNIEQNESGFIIKTSNETFNLKKLDGDNEIYLYDGEYLINSKYLNSYPIIVTDCHEVGVSD
jgi:hypothetical protein